MTMNQPDFVNSPHVASHWNYEKPLIFNGFLLTTRGGNQISFHKNQRFHHAVKHAEIMKLRVEYFINTAIFSM